MPNIQVLDQNTINKIAAGEVIERPASVVKELLENAIDARATAVTIEIKEGGISFIRITDNGCGIAREEIPLAFLRHSTSKIRSVEDLMTVSSLGFRGEALSSIAAVSQVELITKTPSALNGSRYCIDGGVEKSHEEIGCPEGTTFLVRNLFYNTPARRKFLKTAQTEAGYISDMIEKIALSHPEVSIRFINNNQNRLHTSGNHNLKDIIYGIYGRDIAANLLPVEAAMDAVSIRGFIGKPLISRGNRAFENYYVNGRYIKSSMISKAIEEAYQSFMMQHKYPFVVLHIQIDAALLDVNVHPTKMDLRIGNAETIYRFLYETIRSILSSKELIPEVSLDKKDAEVYKPKPEKLTERPAEPFERNRAAREQQMLREAAGYQAGKAAGEAVYAAEQPEPVNPAALQAVQQARMEVIKKPDAGQMQQAAEGSLKQAADTGGTALSTAFGKISAVNASESKNSDMEAFVQEPSAIAAKTPVIETAEQMELFDGRLLSKEAKEQHRIIGQVFETYWMVEYQNKLFFIDQHAAHEKVLYEKTMATLKTREYTSQMLNPPIILTLSMREEELLCKFKSYFEGIGFEIEHFGGKEYAIRAIPDNLFGIAQKEVFLEMLDDLSDELKSQNPQLIYEKVASMSCKAAVKGNHRLSGKEAEALIDELLKLENPYNCPHGRPTIISMTKYEIEKKFKRIV